jgi:hypothetical protein
VWSPGAYRLHVGHPEHKGEAIRRWARKNRVELCFTPTYASWANRSNPLRTTSVCGMNGLPLQARSSDDLDRHADEAFGPVVLTEDILSDLETVWLIAEAL